MSHRTGKAGPKRSRSGRCPPGSPTEGCSSSLLSEGKLTAAPLPFVMTEYREQARDLRLALAGELDLATCASLRARLGQVAQAGVNVRMDLSRLDFIDSSGLHVLVNACRAAHQGGWQLEIEPVLREPVRRTIEIVHLDQVLWPSASVPASLPT